MSDLLAKRLLGEAEAFKQLGGLTQEIFETQERIAVEQERLVTLLEAEKGLYRELGIVKVDEELPTSKELEQGPCSPLPGAAGNILGSILGEDEELTKEEIEILEKKEDDAAYERLKAREDANMYDDYYGLWDGSPDDEKIE